MAFVGLADAFISVSPNPAAPTERRSLRSGSLYFPAAGDIGTVILTFAFHSGL
jgi:hypothetical protein